MVTEEQIQHWADEAEAGYDVDELKRRGRGRPGRGAEPMQVVAVRLTAEELDSLDAAAAKNDMSRSEAIRIGPSRGVKVHPGALKHGVSAEDAVQAAEWSLPPDVVAWARKAGERHAQPLFRHGAEALKCGLPSGGECGTVRIAGQPSDRWNFDLSQSADG